MERICIVSGAGISAESGIKTFRDADGLWEGHDVMQVASPEGWINDQNLVLDFYNQRRAQLLDVEPNLGHTALTALEKDFEVIVITQNVDNLHERAGSSNVMHLHGELNKVRSSGASAKTKFWDKDLITGDLCEDGHQLRPHIVWFGEAVPMIEEAIKVISDCRICIVVGTSMQVYPAAGLVSYLPMDAKIYLVDPKPSLNHELREMNERLKIFSLKASEGIPLVIKEILETKN